ncbi:hypothetical protein GCM10023238_15650 [Streptomyces heliomycini]
MRVFAEHAATIEASPWTRARRDPGEAGPPLFDLTRVSWIVLHREPVAAAAPDGQLAFGAAEGARPRR